MGIKPLHTLHLGMMCSITLGDRVRSMAWRGIPLALVTPIMISIQPLQANPTRMAGTLITSLHLPHLRVVDLVVPLTFIRMTKVIIPTHMITDIITLVATISFSPTHHFSPDLKLTKYDGKVPWRVYEVKFDHMAHKYNWENATKLAKLVEALEDKALTFYSSLPETTQESYSLVKAKFNA